HPSPLWLHIHAADTSGGRWSRRKCWLCRLLSATQMPELGESVHATGRGHEGVEGRGILALDERNTASPHSRPDARRTRVPESLRVACAASRSPRAAVSVHDGLTRVPGNYLPAESDSAMFGGNSNWRGPIWMPLNVLIIRALLQYYLYYGNSF